jgi:hypothetical protein
LNNEINQEVAIGLLEDAAIQVDLAERRDCRPNGTGDDYDAVDGYTDAVMDG